MSVKGHIPIKIDRLLYAWLLLSVFSLVFAGVFAFLVALARTPVLQGLPLGGEYFYIALVGHVVLSVVIWFLAYEGALWTFVPGFFGVRPFSPSLGWLGFWIGAGGTTLLTIPALLGLGTPLLVNYIPVLTHPLFYTGLLLFAAGILITLINTFLTIGKAKKERAFPNPFPLIPYGMSISGVTVLIALLCFALAYYFLSMTFLKGTGPFFERLFWGGGHILQFTNTVAMVTVWVLLTQGTLKTSPLSDRMAKAFLGIYLLFSLPAPFIYFIYDIWSQAYKDGFTLLMQLGLGLPSGLFVLATIVAIGKQGEGSFFSRIKALPWQDPGFSSLFLSVLVFGFGGLISFKIYGSDVRVPAHYHGVVGGVTLAFMGLTYYLLPLLNREVHSKRMAQVQPYLYGIGVFLFALGLFWAGSYGVPRKTFGQDQVLNTYAEWAGMGLMGFGGLISILGGASFVINALMSLLSYNPK